MTSGVSFQFGTEEDSASKPHSASGDEAYHLGSPAVHIGDAPQSRSKRTSPPCTRKHEYHHCGVLVMNDTHCNKAARKSTARPARRTECLCWRSSYCPAKAPEQAALMPEQGAIDSAPTPVISIRKAFALVASYRQRWLPHCSS